MNNDLQAIMARRRRMADDTKQPSNNSSGDIDVSLSDLQHQQPQEPEKGSGNDLQSIMERRRRIADGEVVEEEEVEIPVEQEAPKSALQEIMERRRRIADGEPDPAVLEQQRLEEEQAAAEADYQSMMEAEQPKKGSLHDIMQRRRRLADGEDPGAVNQQLPHQYQQHTNNTTPRASTNVGGVDKLMLAPPGAAPSSRYRPSVAATPVKEDLKSVGVTSEMQKIMERRRRLAETTNFVGDDDDDDDEASEVLIEQDDDDDEQAEEQATAYPMQHTLRGSSGRLSAHSAATPPANSAIQPLAYRPSSGISSPTASYRPSTTSKTPSPGYYAPRKEPSATRQPEEEVAPPPPSTGAFAQLQEQPPRAESRATGAQQDSSPTTSTPTKPTTGTGGRKTKPTSPGDFQPTSAAPPARTKSRKASTSAGKTKKSLSSSSDLKQRNAGRLSSMLDAAADEEQEVEIAIESEEDIDVATVASDLPESLASAEPPKMPSSLLSADDDEEEDDADVQFRSEPVPPARAAGKKAPRRGTRPAAASTVPIVQQEEQITSTNDAGATSSRRTASSKGTSSAAPVVEGKPSSRRSRSSATADDDVSTASSRRSKSKNSGRRKLPSSSTTPLAEGTEEEEGTESHEAPVAEIKTTPRRTKSTVREDTRSASQRSSKGSTSAPQPPSGDEEKSPRRKSRPVTPGPEGAGGDSGSRRGARSSVGSKAQDTEDSGSRRSVRTDSAPAEEEGGGGSRRGPRSLSKMIEDGATRAMPKSDDGSRRGGRSVAATDEESVFSSKKPGTVKRKKTKDGERRVNRKPSGKLREVSEAANSPQEQPKTPASLATTLGESSGSARKSKSGDISVTSGSSGGSMPDDFSKLPSWESRHSLPGEKDGKITVFRRGDKGIAGQWSSATKSWTEIGEVTGGSAVGGSSVVSGSSSTDEPLPSGKARRRKSGDSASASPSNKKDVESAGRRRKTGRSGETRQRNKLLSSTSTDDSESSPRRRRSLRSSDVSDHDDEDLEDDDVEEVEELAPEPPPPPPVSRKKSMKKKSTAPPTTETSEPTSSPVSEGRTNSLEDSATGKSLSGFDSTAWGSVSAFGADANHNSVSADAFSGKAGFSGGFMAGFGDAAFDGATAAAPVTFSSDAFKTDANFDDAFGSPSAFDPAGTSNLFAPASKPEPVYETSPLTGMPTTTIGNIELDQKTVLRQAFQGSLSSNPLNGNVLLCCETRDGAVIREVDTSNGCRQVLSASVLSPELRTKVANKYNASIRGLDKVISMSAGLYQAKGQTRLRVAAILALILLETQQPLNVIAVWQWGNGFPQSVSLLYIMSPPSGSDFGFEPSSLRVADNLLFLGGQSPKGPCVLVSKPSVREAWTSNSLPGTGKISSMEVFMSVEAPRPYIAIALTDKTISVWSFKAGIEYTGAKGKEQQSKRWLAPLCRLNSGQIMNSLDASPLSADGNATGKGKWSTGWSCLILIQSRVSH